ncbi:MAG: flavin-containing monooxygenase [Streptosporangiaceae bacterium]
MDTQGTYDVVVVGGGQAGLGFGHELAARGVSFLIVDAGKGPGASWRTRWDSLRLFTPAGLSALPGLPFPGPPEHLPTKDEVADYLAAYHSNFDLPVRWRTPVHRLAAGGEGYVLQTPCETLTARAVVVATGPFQRPRLPRAARSLDDEVCQVHSSAYRRPDQLPDGPALVVGGGNSGLQIADELARTRPVTLALGSRHPFLPERVAGHSVFSWLDRLGLTRISRGSLLGRYLRRHEEVIVGDSPRLLARRRGVRLVGHVVATRDVALVATDGSVHRPRAVVWATGYVPDFSWVDLPVVAEDGWIRQEAGRTALPGLFTVGLPWQRTNGSALLGWVGGDAARLTDDVAAHAETVHGRPARRP